MHLLTLHVLANVLCPNLEPTSIRPNGHFVRPATELWVQMTPNLSNLAPNIYVDYPTFIPGLLIAPIRIGRRYLNGGVKKDPS